MGRRVHGGLALLFCGASRLLGDGVFAAVSAVSEVLFLSDRRRAVGVWRRSPGVSATNKPDLCEVQSLVCPNNTWVLQRFSNDQIGRRKSAEPYFLGSSSRWVYSKLSLNLRFEKKKSFNNFRFIC